MVAIIIVVSPMFTDEQLAQIKRIVRDEIEVEAEAIKKAIRTAKIHLEGDLLDLKDSVKDVTIRINKLYACEQEGNAVSGGKDSPKAVDSA
jgi:hypothetical protein